MAFMIYSVDDGHVPAWEYLPAGAITPKVGMALTQTSGNLAVAGATVKPTYISMVEKDTACTAGDLIPVIRVTPDIVFATTNTAAITAATVGSKVTTSAGLQVTNTTSSGVAEVIAVDDKAKAGANGTVLVRFA